MNRKRKKKNDRADQSIMKITVCHSSGLFFCFFKNLSYQMSKLRQINLLPQQRLNLTHWVPRLMPDSTRAVTTPKPKSAQVSTLKPSRSGAMRRFISDPSTVHHFLRCYIYIFSFCSVPCILVDLIIWTSNQIKLWHECEMPDCRWQLSALVRHWLELCW